MKRLWLRWLIGAVTVLAIVLYGFTFVLYEGDVAVIERFGAPRVVVEEAGIHTKLPWPFEQLHVYDSRKHLYDSSHIESLTKDKRNVVLQTYVIWSIEDPLRFVQSTGNIDTAGMHINTLVTGAKTAVLGNYELSALVSTSEEELKLAQIQQDITDEITVTARDRYGLGIHQLGLKKLGLPEANLAEVFSQMRAERLQYVAQLEAEGQRDASIIRNEADVEVAELTAEGVEEAARILGETEKEVARIYAEAYSRNPDFYAFLRKLESLENILGEQSTLIFRLNDPPFNVLGDID